MEALKLYNNLTRRKEEFKPIQEGRVHMYVCGPTVYSDVHIGNCRTFVSFDIIFRYLKYLGYTVRYVRNITDVGHLTDDADAGEDKIGRKARQERLEPMEIVQRYTNGFHDMMRIFNTLPPSIEPRATGHIIEQIEMVQQILDNGYAYVANGSVYFDTLRFAEKTGVYGQLSGRKIEELQALTRDDLKNQNEKRHPSDFAIWMRAQDNHIMRWNSPWSVGFPGWHLECSVMSTKYLGETFDIHGGGNDLKFPHHENEIAQNMGACNCQPANYWLHTNMLLLNGRKMSKSDDNSITPTELFTGDSKHISKGFSPMALRFFMLQSHYSSTLDLTDDALIAGEKGYLRLCDAMKALTTLESQTTDEGELDHKVRNLLDQAFAEMNDDFNTPKSLSKVFELVPIINSLASQNQSTKTLSIASLERLRKDLHSLFFDIYGLTLPDDLGSATGNQAMETIMDLILELRQEARTQKDWNTSDRIRDGLQEAGIIVKDGKEGTQWKIKH